MEDLAGLDNLKFRAGYGEVGNQEIGNYQYGVSLTNHPTYWGTGLAASNIANKDLQWETSRTLNMGIDVALFGNRIELIADIYKKYTDNLLMNLPLPMYLGTSGTGSIAPPTVNIGKMENQGYEITLNTINTTGLVKWNTGITFSRNKNTVTDVADNVIDRNIQWFTHVTRSDVGRPVGQFYGYVTEGLFQDAEDINNHAEQASRVARLNGTWVGDVKFKDISGPNGEPDGKITEDDRTFIGDPNPDFSFGISNSLSYKGFDLNILLTGMYGNDVLNYTRIYTESLTGQTNQVASVNDRAIIELIDANGSKDDINNVRLANPGTDVPRISRTDPNGNTRISDRFVEDGSFLRVKNISFGYNLPKYLINKIGMSGCKIYVNLQNIHTFTKYSGFDPEVGNYNQDPLLMGVDNGYYPQPTIYTIGANINF
ncbi:MAG: TonB-dependent receptor [Prolixibacteraceae bacterium]|nr:TonB-dependent receptor [Prolixibacteraceae bacterium]